MSINEIIELTDTYLISTYNRFPVIFTRGKGCYLYDEENKEYLDFLCGLGVNNLGHGYPSVVYSIKEQIEKLLHVSNLYYIAQQAKLAELVVKHAFAGKMFFCNSGAEANEAAIKLARLYAKDKGITHPEIITAQKSFHGRTLATVAATGQKKVQKGFEPLFAGFNYVPFQDLSAIEKAINDSTAAVMIEPIQGEGGVHVGSPEYLMGVRDICTKRGVLLILDEVQTGLGRTGKLFCYQHTDIEPDILTMAKALGGGLPIGAILAKKQTADHFVPGTHATTFGGNPLSCSAAMAVVHALVNEGILESCQKIGLYFEEKLRELQGKYPFIQEVRGKGLMWGMELNKEGAQIVKDCLDQGLIINCTMGNVLRFLPPLIISHHEVDKGLAILDKVLSKE